MSPTAATPAVAAQPVGAIRPSGAAQPSVAAQSAGVFAPTAAGSAVRLHLRGMQRTRRLRGVLAVTLLVAIVGVAAPALSQAPRRLVRSPLLVAAGQLDARPGLALLGNIASLGQAEPGSLGLAALTPGARFDGERAGGWAAGATMAIGELGFGVLLARAVESAPPGGSQGIGGMSSVGVGVGYAVGGWLGIGAALRSELDLAPTTWALALALRVDVQRWLQLSAQLEDALAATRYLRPASQPIVAGPQLVVAARIADRSDRLALHAELRFPEAGAGRALRLAGEVRLHDDLQLGLEWRRELDRDAGVPARAAEAARVGSSREGAVASRLAGALRWTEGALELAPVVFVDLQPEATTFGFGLTLAWRWQSMPAVPTRTIARRRARRPAGLAEAELSAAARVVLAVHAAMAAEDGKALCALLASDGARLDVESVDPPLSLHQSASREVICRDLAQRQGPWARYLRELGPADVHAQMARFLPTLFRVHGGVIGELPREREALLAATMARDSKDLRCRGYRLSPFEGLGGVRLYDVALTCPGHADVRLILVPEPGGPRLGKLAVDHRPGQQPPPEVPAAVAPPGPSPKAPAAGGTVEPDPAAEGD